MRSKLMRVTAIALIVGTALAALGAGAALWNSTIAVNGKVNSGKVSAQITHAFTDDDDVVNFPFLDGNDTGQCQDVGHVALPGSTTSSCDPPPVAAILSLASRSTWLAVTLHSPPGRRPARSSRRTSTPVTSARRGSLCRTTARFRR